MTRQFAAHAGPVTLSQGAEYDAQDRILREIFPDGSTLEHDYSPRGLERPLAHVARREQRERGVVEDDEPTLRAGEVDRRVDGHVGIEK